MTCNPELKNIAVNLSNLEGYRILQHCSHIRTTIAFKYQEPYRIIQVNCTPSCVLESRLLTGTLFFYENFSHFQVSIVDFSRDPLHSWHGFQHEAQVQIHAKMYMLLPAE